MKKSYGANGWLPGEAIPDLILDMSNPVGIEIGTSLGYTTEYLLGTNPNLTLHGVDPYSAYTDWNGAYFDDTFKDNEYLGFLDRISANASRYTHHRKTSDDAVSDFADESIDFIFIDGIHTYGQVLKDCQNYYPKLKRGGLFCGHDFTQILGVGQAVAEFSGNVGRVPRLTLQDVWYWYK